MSELSPVPAMPVAVLPTASQPAPTAAPAGPAFGAVLRESLTPSDRTSSVAVPSQPAVAGTAPALGVPNGRQVCGQSAPSGTVPAGSPAQPAMLAVVTGETLPSVAGAPTPTVGGEGTIPAKERPKSAADAALSTNAGLIAAAAAAVLPVPVPMMSVAATSAGGDGRATPGAQPGLPQMTFTLPATITGSMTYLSDGGRTAFGLVGAAPRLGAPFVAAQPAASGMAAPIDLKPGPITIIPGGAAPTQPAVPAPAATIGRLPAMEMPGLEVGMALAAEAGRGSTPAATATAVAPQPELVTGLTLTDAPASTAAPTPAETEEEEDVEETTLNGHAEVAQPETVAVPAFDPPAGDVAEVAAGPSQAALDADSAWLRVARTTRGTAASRPAAPGSAAGPTPAVTEVGPRDGVAPDADGSDQAETDDDRDTALAGVMPRPAAMAIVATAYQAATAAATGRAADVATATLRTPAQDAPRETVHSSPPRTLAGVEAAQAAGAAAPASTRTVDQVASALALNVRDGRTEATISLRPGALGEVRVQIIAGQDGLVIHLSAERDAVGELLRTRVGELRQALAGHQVAVSELHVLHNPPAVASPAPDARDWQERPWSRRDPNPETGDEGGNRGGEDDTDDTNS